MSARMSFIIFPIVASLLLSGCSFADIFAKLATTNEEQGASEAMTRSKIVEAKQKKIDQMKQQYADNTELKNTTETHKGVGYSFRKKETTGTEIRVEVMLPDAGRQLYEVWLRETNGKGEVRLGALQFNNTDDYSLVYTTTDDMTRYGTITISLEAVPDDTQETIVMIGAFADNPTSSSLP